MRVHQLHDVGSAVSGLFAVGLPGTRLQPGARLVIRPLVGFGHRLLLGLLVLGLVVLRVCRWLLVRSLVPQLLVVVRLAFWLVSVGLTFGLVVELLVLRRLLLDLGLGLLVGLGLGPLELLVLQKVLVVRLFPIEPATLAEAIADEIRDLGDARKAGQVRSLGHRHARGGSEGGAGRERLEPGEPTPWRGPLVLECRLERRGCDPVHVHLHRASFPGEAGDLMSATNSSCGWTPNGGCRCCRWMSPGSRTPASCSMPTGPGIRRTTPSNCRTTTPSNRPRTSACARPRRSAAFGTTSTSSRHPRSRRARIRSPRPPSR